MQGKKLRNKIIESIVSNDPFCVDIFDVKHYNSSASEVPLSSSTSSLQRKVHDLSPEDHEKIHTYLKGYPMSRDDELFAMDLLKSLSAVDLCKTTEKVYCNSHTKCSCSICEAYNKENLNCNVKRASDKGVTQACDVDNAVRFTDEIKEKYKLEHNEVLKYIDCLKVCVHSVNLNNAGMKKLSLSCDRISLSAVTYFVEYRVPQVLVEKPKSKSKTDSGWNSTDLVRMCSRKEQNGAIYFKHTTVHDIHNVDKYNLEDIEMTFVISCRSPKQKQVNVLGCAVFDFGLLEVSRNLTCNRELFIKLKEQSPIVTGTIKVSFQFGSGRLYFGKELIDAVKVNAENSVAVCYDDVSISDSEKILKKEREQKNKISKKNDVDKSVEKSSSLKPTLPVETKSKVSQTVNKKTSCKSVVNKEISCESVEIQTERDTVSQTANKGNTSSKSVEIQTERDTLVPQKAHSLIQENERELLFGFLYISQAQFLKKPLNSYIVCKLFGQHDSSQSRVIDNTANPVFNFCQIVPLIYEDSLLEVLRDNFMVIEIFENLNSRDIIIGVVKVSLHQFYLAFKNPVVFKYLKKNKLPIIGTDWWEPISNPFTEEIVGQIQILTALGTAEQINNLEADRGFKKYNVTAAQIRFVRTSESSGAHFEKGNKLDTPQTYNVLNVDVNHDKSLRSRVDTVNSAALYEHHLYDIKTCDIGVQSDIIMENKSSGEKTNPTQAMLDAFLNKLIAQKPKNNCVENSTNTENNVAKTEKIQTIDDKLNNACQQTTQSADNLQLRKTSDLLDSLQKALSVDSTPKKQNELAQPSKFKVHIKIEKALHLPSRRKCKSKKSRNKGVRMEDILPSTYVTFETLPGASIIITKVCQKSTSPNWDFEGDFDLPMEYLVNSQKRLIFKVWRKSTNTNLQPHMHTDVVLGFAALDLTVLTTGLSSIKGWFNIVDFSGKINGQINISITPLENLLRYNSLKESDECTHKLHQDSSKTDDKTECSGDLLQIAENSEEPGELLSRALKRKFTELDEITQRLRLRLSKVTNDDSDVSNDELVEEFERDINTLCVEDDFNMVNFEGSSENLSIYDPDSACIKAENSNALKIDCSVVNPHDKSLSTLTMDISENLSETSIHSQGDNLMLQLQCNTNLLDQGLLKEKQRIDILLEKLNALQTCETKPSKNEKRHVESIEKSSSTSGCVSSFSNRHVSGCSVNHEDPIDTEALLVALDHDSRPNIHSCTNYDPSVFQQIYASGSKLSDTNSDKSSSSNASILTSCSRFAPDGAGPPVDDEGSDSPNP